MLNTVSFLMPLIPKVRLTFRVDIII